MKMTILLNSHKLPKRITSWITILKIQLMTPMAWVECKRGFPLTWIQLIMQRVSRIPAQYSKVSGPGRSLRWYKIEMRDKHIRVNKLIHKIKTKRRRKRNVHSNWSHTFRNEVVHIQIASHLQFLTWIIWIISNTYKIKNRNQNFKRKNNFK